MVQNRGSAWNEPYNDECRPIYTSLPGVFGQYFSDNEPSNYLTSYWDSLYCNTKHSIDDLKTHLNPLTCDAKYLPLLGVLAGFSENYAILNCFDIQCQRNIINKSHSFIWPNKGSKAVLDYLLDCLGISYTLYSVDNFLADINVAGDAIGGTGEELINFYLVSDTITRNSSEWNKLKLIIDLFTPIYASHTLTYEHFKAGISACGEPVFD